MPTYIYTCPEGHTLEKFKPTAYKRIRRYRCKKCGLYATRDYKAEHSKQKKDIHINPNDEPLSHMLTKRGFKGIMIEHLTPEPVFVRDKAQYDKLLKETHSLEKETRYGG